MNELGLLYRYLPTELTPPEDMWDRLVKVLDDDQPNAFENMAALEIEPPPMAWENIAATLDETDNYTTAVAFKNKFENAELPPPAFVWDEIEKSLNGKPAVKNLAGNAKIVGMVAVGVAVAACLASVIFTVFKNTDNQLSTKNTAQVAIIKSPPTVPQTDSPQKTLDDNGRQPQAKTKTQAAYSKVDNNTTLADNNSLSTDSDREFGLKQYNNTLIPNINTTNNKVASITKKIRDAFGNVLDDIRNYTSSGYIAAIGPNGNSVNVSTKLADMIPFFQEDSATVKNEEYLDRVMRETNVWRQKLKDWQTKVNSADNNPSQMNFLDPIDLLRFLEKNK